jgi:hypothetical protein
MLLTLSGVHESNPAEGLSGFPSPSSGNLDRPSLFTNDELCMLRRSDMEREIEAFH